MSLYAQDEAFQEIRQKTIQLYTKAKFTEALRSANELITLKPSDAFSYKLRAAIYVDLDKFAEARKDFSQAGELDPDDAFTHFNIGETYFLDKYYSNAIKHFRNFMKKEPNNELALFKIFLCNILSEQQQEVDQALSTLQPSPVSPLYYFAHAAIAFNKENPDKANELISTANNIYPNDQILTFVDSFLELGWVKTDQNVAKPIISGDKLKSMSSQSFHAEPIEAPVLTKLEDLLPLDEEEDEDKEKQEDNNQ
ncbi:MAG: tetratricopeptide repeat protein [Verrucomicrobiota bacterium]